MSLSWEIQKRNREHISHKIQRSNGTRTVRSLALESAWTIVLTEEITVFHLARRYKSERHPNTVIPSDLTLFQTK